MFVCVFEIKRALLCGGSACVSTCAFELVLLSFSCGTCEPSSVCIVHLPVCACVNPCLCVHFPAPYSSSSGVAGVQGPGALCHPEPPPHLLCLLVS